MASRAQAINVYYRAWNTSTGDIQTADAAHHTLKWRKDGVEATPTNAPAETSEPGTYGVLLTAAEATCNDGVIVGTSSTAGVRLFGVPVTFEQLPTAAAGAADGLPALDASAHLTVDVVNDKSGYALSAAGVLAIWNTLLTALTTAGSIGLKLASWVLGSDNKVLLSADAQTGVTIPTVTQVTGGATAANQTSILNAVNAITTNTTRTGLTVPAFAPIPAAGSTPIKISIKLYNLQGQLEDADANTVTIHASDSGGVSEDVNLTSTTATRDAAGEYHGTYNLPSTAAEGGVYLDVTYAIGGVAMAASVAIAAAQADTVTAIAAIKAQTDKLAFDASNNVKSAPQTAGTLTTAYDAAKTAAAPGAAMQVGSYAAGQDPYSQLKSIVPSNTPVAGELEWILRLADADAKIDTTTTPWTLKEYVRGTATLLRTRRLFDVSGANIGDTSTVLGEALV